MAVVTVDNSNLADIMAEAGVEEVATEAKVEAKGADKPGDKQGTEATTKTDTAAKVEEVADDADDVEDEEGVTARQKRELSGKMLKAIGKKHRQVKEAEEFAAHQYREKQAAQTLAADLDRQLKEVTARTQTAKAAEEVEPVREAFSSDAEFMKASIKWGVDRGIRDQKAREQAEERQLSVQQQFKRAADLVPDFEQVVNKQLTYPQSVATYMRESDMFAELGYHFAKNPAALEKLAALPGVRQLVELGKIEARLAPFGSSASSPEAGEKPNVEVVKTATSTVDTGFSPSKARSDAPVIKPLTSGEGTQVEPDVREMNTRQMIERFQKDQKVNLHARKRH